MILDFWRRNLLFRTVGSIVAISSLVGGLIVLAMSVSAARQTEASVYQHIAELIDTVENTANIACFVGNAELATEVARGLLNSSLVLGVDVLSQDAALVSLKRRFDSPDSDQEKLPWVHRQLHSPFEPDTVVGEIRIMPDKAAIDAAVSNAWQRIALQTFLMSVAVTLVLVLMVWLRVVRPVTMMSRRLHALDPSRGEHLLAPQGHEYDEFGSLVADINALSAGLLGAIETEQRLNRRHEIDEAKYRDIFENAESGIFIADASGCMNSYNQSLARLLGLESPVFDVDMAVSLTALPWEDTAVLAAMIRRCVDGSLVIADDLELARSITPRRWLNLSLTPIGNGLVQGILVDVSKRRQAEMSALRMAVTDSLTGLPNRQGFEEYCARQIVDRPEQSFTLLLIDLEGFKQLNDALGFPAGDRVLIGFAARIFSCVKESDWTARVGGDEFAVLLRNVGNARNLGGICQRILDNLRERFTVSGQEAVLGASIGATLYPSDGDDLPTLLRNAELALNDARCRGGQRWSMFDQGMTLAVERRHSLASDLRVAIERNELCLHYQPIVDLLTGKVVGAEALMRWQHPVHGLVPPDHFIPLAEQSGLINDIGEWCLETACAQLATWLAEKFDLYVTVNVSVQQIPDGLSLEKIAEAVARHGIAPERLGLEITEGLLLGESDGTQRWLESLREAGFSIYLDDFGTGYSSLSYLKRFRVDKVKIDRAFVRDMGRVQSDRVMTEAVVMMAGSLGLGVVAEGIENAEQLGILKSIGCSYGQGYFFSKPVAPDVFPSVVKGINHPDSD